MKTENGIKDKLNIGFVMGFMLIFMVVGIISPDKEISESERRKKIQAPKLTVERVLDGSYMREFEQYRLDQFPIHDHFRTLKAIVSYGLMEKKDNNDLYVEKGYVSKLDATLHEESIKHATDRFSYIYDSYLKDTDAKIYLSIIPDKNYFLAKEYGYPSMDYDALIQGVKKGMPYATYVDIMTELELGDYYRTDSHWRQECIEDVAKMVGKAMGVTLKEKYQQVELENPFYGVYYGQSALPLKADTLCYVENKCLDECRVFDCETNEEKTVYDLERAEGMDPYEIFLSGPKSLLFIENTQTSSKKELVIFRDSFGSSIAPYLVEGYSKITLVDIRYISPTLLQQFIDFDHQDVLFLYSTAVLNNSNTIK